MKQKYLRFFPLGVLIFGLAYTFIVPPFQVPDEYMHFARTLNLLSGHTRAIKDGPRMGYQIDCRAAYFIRQMPHEGEYKSQGKYPWADFRRVTAESRKEQGTCFWEIEPGSMQMHVPYLYAPQAVGIFIAQKFSPAIAVWLYTGRIFNLLFCVFLIWLALRLMPGSPLRLIYFMSIPMYLHVAGSLSGDAMAISFAFVFFALVARALTEPAAMTARFWWIALLTSVFLGMGKSVYFPLVILLLLIPLQTKRRQDLLKSLGIIAVSLTGLLAWNWVVKNDYYKTPTFIMDPAAQTQWFLAHPFLGIKAVLGAFVYEAHKIAVLYFGVFGWLSVIMPFAWYVLYFAVGALLFVSHGGDVNLWQSRWNRIAFILIPLGIAVLLSLIMYITFTPVGYPHTKGIQGRHLMPLMSFLIFALFTRSRLIRWKAAIEPAVVLTIAALNIWALGAIYLQYNG